MEEKQKQMKLSQQQPQQQQQQHQQKISPKSISVVQLGAKRTVSQKDEDVRQFESFLKVVSFESFPRLNASLLL